LHFFGVEDCSGIKDFSGIEDCSGIVDFSKVCNELDGLRGVSVRILGLQNSALHECPSHQATS